MGCQSPTQNFSVYSLTLRVVGALLIYEDPLTTTLRLAVACIHLHSADTMEPDTLQQLHLWLLANTACVQ